MARLIASLHEPNGRVAVAGFYDEVRELQRRRARRHRRVAVRRAAYLAQVGAPSAFGEPGYTTLERQWTRPTLEVNGMWGGYQGPGQKTVIPTRGAREDHVPARARSGSRRDRATGDASPRVARAARHSPVAFAPAITARVPIDIAADHFALAAADAALQATYGVRPLVVRMGGTVPIAELFKRHMGLDTVFFSFSTADEDSTRRTSSFASTGCTRDSRPGRGVGKFSVRLSGHPSVASLLQDDSLGFAAIHRGPHNQAHEVSLRRRRTTRCGSNRVRAASGRIPRDGYSRHSRHRQSRAPAGVGRGGSKGRRLRCAAVRPARADEPDDQRTTGESALHCRLEGAVRIQVQRHRLGACPRHARREAAR